MKPLNDRKTKSTFPILSIIVVVILYCTGCDKEDLPVPLDTTNNSSERQAPLKTTPFYTLININHNGGFSLSGVSYDINVRSSGEAIFNGYRNVAKIGIVKFEVPKEKMLQIAELIKKYNFFSIEDDLKYIPDEPYVTTTCALPEAFVNEGVDYSRSLIDFNRGYPETLIQLRKEVEQLLNIAPYINEKQARSVIALPAQY